MKITDVTSIPGVTRTRARKRVRPTKRTVTRWQPKVDRDWTGPKGSDITIIAGSMAKPPRALLLLIDRILHRNWPWHNGSIRVLIRNCRRGCAHGYGSKHHLSLYLSSDSESNRFLVEHEMAHVTNRKYGDRHGPGFYDALYRIGKDEGNLRALTEWQSNKAAMRRARQRVEGRAA